MEEQKGFTITPEMYEAFKNDASEMFCTTMTGAVTPPKAAPEVALSKESAMAVKEYFRGIQGRINSAKDAIEHWNFGEALAILSEPYPPLKVKEK